MKASRRDYEAMASLVYRTVINNRASRKLFAERLSDILIKSNPAFDRAKFIRACLEGLENG